MDARGTDLVADIFSEMSVWGLPPGSDFAERMFNKYSGVSALSVREAIVMASKLQVLVLKSASFYHEPYATIHEKVRSYLRDGLPGLSDGAYSAAKDRIMFMYLK